MNSRTWNPERLDVELFARQQAGIDGVWPLAGMERLVSLAHSQALPGDADVVTWQARGELRAARGGVGETWLHLSADATVQLVCQRCLGPVACPVDAERSFHFVVGEDAAAELDADSEDDVLAMTRALDLRALVEDELLLSLPVVPRHEVCPEPLPAGTAEDDDEDEPERRQPFAALAALKRKGPLS